MERETSRRPVVVASGRVGGGVGWMARMTSTRVRLATARLYLCTDARSGPADLTTFLDEVLAGGVDLVQLRQKGMEAGAELAALQIMAAASKRHGALMCVNDRADVAYAARADMLHLGQGDLPVTVAREILGDDVIVGRSTHAIAEAQAALIQPGVDYIAVGPCWPTPTKPGRPAPGLDLVRQVAGHVADRELLRPWFAIGGIDLPRLPQVLAAGATRVVVVRALTEASDPRAAAASFSRALDRPAERG